MTGRQFSIALAALLLSGCGSVPHDAAMRVPLGSRLIDLDRHFARGSGSRGEVVQWLAKGTSREKSERIVRTAFGSFESVKLGSYDLWRASAAERDRFTGEITFTHHGSTSTDVSAFIYVGGRLRKKDWGFLPGYYLSPGRTLRNSKKFCQSERVGLHPASISMMKTLGKGCLAGWIANKWGGGCLGTIILFLIVYWLLTQVFG